MRAQASIQLIVAARDGDLATVRRVLAEGRVDVNTTDEVQCFSGRRIQRHTPNAIHLRVFTFLIVQD